MRLLLAVLAGGVALGLALDEALRQTPHPAVFVVAAVVGVFALLCAGDALEVDVLGGDR